MSTEEVTIDGLVLYTDGSFRDRKAGWGIHGYLYTKKPLKQGIGLKMLPTANGYLEVPLDKTVTPVEYIDAYGHVTLDPTNNTGELEAAIKGFELAEKLGVNSVVIRLDSEYVNKGLTKYVNTWIKNNWVKSDGNPVANRSYWERLVALDTAWKEAGKKAELRWVKGHNGEPGNDAADLNARLGSGLNRPDFMVRSPAQGYHKPVVDASPFILKKRLIAMIGDDAPPSDNYYYMYQLGRMHAYGHKKEDTVKERMEKTDLIFGRRVSEATFAIYKANEPDEYIETLINTHNQAHKRDSLAELAIILLDNAYRPALYNMIKRMGLNALVPYNDIKALVTSHDDLISRTHSPARMAYDGVYQFSIMRKRLDDFLAGTLGDGVMAIDITSAFYAQETSGKKVQTKLHKTITNNTPLIEVEAVVKGVKAKLKLVLGIDIPQRNQLAKIAELEPTVTALVVADGPVSYSFSTVFTSTDGAAIYQSPYTQFVLAK